MFITDIFENDDDMFAATSKLSQEVERSANNPLKPLEGVDADDHEEFINELQYTARHVKTDDQLAAAMDVFEGQLDEPLCAFIDSALAGSFGNHFDDWFTDARLNSAWFGNGDRMKTTATNLLLTT